MNIETNDFPVDSFRADLIEDIAKENKTIFTNFDDFVSEAIGTYINWWKFPEKSQSNFLTLLPHMKPEMLENLKTEMPIELFENITKGLEEIRKGLELLPFEPSPPGKKRYHLDEIRFDVIKEIIDTENVNKKIKTVKEFVDKAITLYVTWWTKPEKIQPLMYDIWPYMPIDTKLGWENNPKWKEAFIEFNKKAKEWAKKQNNNSTDVEDNNYKKIDNEINKKTRQQEIFELPTEKPTMQSASKDGGFFFNRLCKQMNKVKNDSIFDSLPKHRSTFSLPYDNYPLIWDFYSRILPTKILISVLANMMMEQGSTTVDYKEYREKAYYAALGLAERLSDYEKKWTVKRNEKKSTGFPISPIDTLGKIDLKKMTKFEASKQRFQEHFIGMKQEAWIKRQPHEEDRKEKIKEKSKKMNKGLAYFDGALNAMGLVVVYALNHDEEPVWKKYDKNQNDISEQEENKWVYENPSQSEWSLQIGLTKRGYEFYKLENPIFKNYEEQWWEEVLSKDESKFILEKIIPDFPLENKFINKAIEVVSKAETATPNYISGKIMDEEFEVLSLEWLQKNKNHQSYKLISKCRDDPKMISSWRARTMGRLTEMRQIKWDFEKMTGAAKYTLNKQYN